MTTVPIQDSTLQYYTAGESVQKHSTLTRCSSCRPPQPQEANHNHTTMTVARHYSTSLHMKPHTGSCHHFKKKLYSNKFSQQPLIFSVTQNDELSAANISYNKNTTLFQMTVVAF